MARPKKIPTDTPEPTTVPTVSVIPAVAPVEQHSNKVLETPEKVKGGIYCKQCTSLHEKSFNGPGINHDRFPKGGSEEIMFNHLASQPLVSTLIPMQDTEKEGAFHTVILNNLRINILKGAPNGKMPQVPQQVAETIAESFYQTARASQPLIKNPFSGEEKSANLASQSESDKARLDR